MNKGEIEGAIDPYNNLKIIRPENLKLRELIEDVVFDVKKRVKEITTPRENPVDEERKNKFIKFADEVLKRRGIKQIVENVPWHGHEGEGITYITTTKRVTPPIQISETQAIRMSDSDPYALSDKTFVRDDILIEIIDRDRPDLTKPAYRFGRTLKQPENHKNRTSFFDMPGHIGTVTNADLINANRYVKLIDIVAPLAPSEPQLPSS